MAYAPTLKSSSRSTELIDPPSRTVFPRGRSAKLRVPAIAAAAVPRRNEPLHSNVRLGERTSVQGLSQIHSDEFGHLSDGRGRYRAPIPASKHTETGRPVRGHLANGAMQRLRAEPRAVCARAVQYHRR